MKTQKVKLWQRLLLLFIFSLLGLFFIAIFLFSYGIWIPYKFDGPFTGQPVECPTETPDQELPIGKGQVLFVFDPTHPTFAPIVSLQNNQNQ